MVDKNWHVVCGNFGNIYISRLNKDGRMNATGRRECNQEATESVVQRMMSTNGYEESGNISYRLHLKNGGSVMISVYDPEQWTLAEGKVELENDEKEEQ